MYTHFFKSDPVPGIFIKIFARSNELKLIGNIKLAYEKAPTQEYIPDLLAYIRKRIQNCRKFLKCYNALRTADVTAISLNFYKHKKREVCVLVLADV